ncbi:MAG: GNAT family N-acetyltransferase [Gemmatimonadota bacterium]
MSKTANIREMERGEDFAEWFADLLDRDAAGDEFRNPPPDERYLVLSNEVGDWIGGLRYQVRGGVAHLLDIAVAPEERGQGHGHLLLGAFEDRAREAGAHVAEFWTASHGVEAWLVALGWKIVLHRDDYFDHGAWILMEKRLTGDRGA